MIWGNARFLVLFRVELTWRQTEPLRVVLTAAHYSHHRSFSKTADTQLPGSRLVKPHFQGTEEDFDIF